MLNLTVTGPQGPQGTSGAQGSQGNQGAQGTQGPSGGAQGAQGYQGIEGAQGVQGLPGTQGAQGTPGVQGSQGVQGFQGSSGNPGSLNYVQNLGDSSVSLLLHMDGTNGSTTFTDRSFTPKTPVNTGPTINTSISKFGSASGYFNGSTFLSYANSSDFNFSGGTYTIEGWVNPSSVSSLMTIVAKATSGISVDWAFNIDNATTVSFWVSGQGSPSVSGTVPTIVPGTWHHFAAVSDAGIVSVYWNGIRIGISPSTMTTVHTAALITLGCYRNNDPAYYYNGYMDEIRLTKGTARYTANFTPPASPFSNADGSAELVASNVGEVIFSGEGIFVCTSLSPLTWKRFTPAATVVI